MKTLKTLIFALLSFNAFAFQETIECSGRSLNGVSSFKLVGGWEKVVGYDRAGYPITEVENPGNLIIYYEDGRKETLEPQSGVGGLFDQLDFSGSFIGSVSSTHFRNYHFPNSMLGDIKIRVRCLNQASDISCRSWGGSADKAHLLMNINNSKLVKYDREENPTCKLSYSK